MEQRGRTRALELLVLGARIRIVSPNADVQQLLIDNFGRMQRPIGNAQPEFEYRVSHDPAGYRIIGANDTTFAADSYELLYDLEKRITVDVQHRRKDLLFVHAAALEFEGRGYLLAAPPGSGKSTTAWALANQGFGYLSDELAPIDLHTMEVLPYPHAICLKAPPAAPFGLPDRVIRTTRTIHVPADLLPRVTAIPVPLGGLIFNTYDNEAAEPSLRVLSAGEAGAKLYSNVLNHLAHPNAGLASVARVARTPSYALVTTRDLSCCARLLKRALRANSGIPVPERVSGSAS